MAIRKIIAREFTWEVESATAGTWLAIGGLTTFSRSLSKTDTDTTDFDDDGVEAHLVGSRGASYSLEGHYLEDTEGAAVGDRDVGQARCEEVALLVGAASINGFRFTTPGMTVVTIQGSCVVTGPGGGSNDSASWSVAIMRSGPEVIT